MALSHLFQNPSIKKKQKIFNFQNNAILKALEDSKKCPIIYLKNKTLGILWILLKASKTCHFGHLLFVIFCVFFVSKSKCPKQCDFEGFRRF